MLGGGVVGAELCPSSAGFLLCWVLLVLVVRLD